MLVVVMGADTSRAAAEAVREKLGEAGLDAGVFEGAGHVLVGAEGEVPPETEASLKAMFEVQAVMGAGENGAPETRDLRITDTRPMLPPEILLEQLPLSREGATTVSQGRGEVSDVLGGRDDRLVVVVGP